MGNLGVLETACVDASTRCITVDKAEQAENNGGVENKHADSDDLRNDTGPFEVCVDANNEEQRSTSPLKVETYGLKLFHISAMDLDPPAEKEASRSPRSEGTPRVQSDVAGGSPIPKGTSMGHDNSSALGAKATRPAAGKSSRPHRHAAGATREGGRRKSSNPTHAQQLLLW